MVKREEDDEPEAWLISRFLRFFEAAHLPNVHHDPGLLLSQRKAGRRTELAS
jgi:hypothetical protein